MSTSRKALRVTRKGIGSFFRMYDIDRDRWGRSKWAAARSALRHAWWVASFYWHDPEHGLGRRG